MQKCVLILLLSFNYATIINVPSDYETIQGGISAAQEGDTVLVEDGTYFENLILDKDITLASHFIIDGNLCISYKHIVIRIRINSSKI